MKRSQSRCIQHTRTARAACNALQVVGGSSLVAHYDCIIIMHHMRSHKPSAKTTLSVMSRIRPTLAVLCGPFVPHDAHSRAVNTLQYTGEVRATSAVMPSVKGWRASSHTRHGHTTMYTRMAHTPWLHLHAYLGNGTSCSLCTSQLRTCAGLWRCCTGCVQVHSQPSQACVAASNSYVRRDCAAYE